jgi:hypothetical protein
VALLSEATATKAPPIPNARLPTLSTTWADDEPAEPARMNAHTETRTDRLDVTIRIAAIVIWS